MWEREKSCLFARERRESWGTIGKAADLCCSKKKRLKKEARTKGRGEQNGLKKTREKIEREGDGGRLGGKDVLFWH
jgi:hypothetical protein